MSGLRRAGEVHRLIRVSGADHVAFLDGLLSQDLGAMMVGEIARALLLTPHGKVRAALWVERREACIDLVVDASVAAATRADLDRYRFRVDVALEELPVETVFAPVGGGGPEPAGIPMPFPDGTPRYAVTPGPVRDRSDPDGYELVRIRSGEPRVGVDVDDRTIPQEAFDVAVFVSFTKGCYLGQELVARIDSRGRVNRFLRRIRATAPMAAGDPVVAAGSAVGTLTSVAGGPEGWMGLALVRREIEPGRPVEVGGERPVAATVEAVSHLT